MKKSKSHFHGILSSDWSECLSPSGPFDFIAFNFPQLAPELNEVFRSYTGNLISLGRPASGSGKSCRDRLLRT